MRLILAEKFTFRQRLCFSLPIYFVCLFFCSIKVKTVFKTLCYYWFASLWDVCFQQIFYLPLPGNISLLRCRSGRSHATLPVPTRGEGERCVTPARAAEKETRVTWEKVTSIDSTASTEKKNTSQIISNIVVIVILYAGNWEKRDLTRLKRGFLGLRCTSTLNMKFHLTLPPLGYL